MKIFHLAVVACLLAWAAGIARAVEETWIFAVQVTANVQASPARIELNWLADASSPATSYTIYRKLPSDPTWGNGVELPGSATSYADETASIGTIYEYQIVKQAIYPATGAPYKAYGYIAAAINAPLVDQRGKLILVVDNSIAAPISAELERLQRDLIGDGWIVVRKDVARDAAPPDVKALIKAEYEADRERVKAVFLLGHVPILRSGNLNVDDHEARPMPADVFYGDMDGVWTDANGDGIYDQSLLPSDVELQVGRVDFADLTGETINYRFPSEVELLKRYLDKDHAYRHAIVRPALRALIANPIGDAKGQAYAASGYRTFAPLVGPSNVTTIETQSFTPASERWISYLGKTDYLWAYGCGSGGDYTVNELGSHGEFNGLWSQDFIEQKAKATFYQLFGSWFVDWSKPDNLMRSALTAPDYGLAVSWAGRPHQFFHYMGIGETIGYGIRLTQNNTGTLYQNQVQRQLRGVHIALIGDPSLRMHMIVPPGDVAASDQGGSVRLTWKPSTDDVLGYHVYRSTNNDAFVRITDGLVTGTQFTDATRSTESTIYMVRAVALHVGPSGSYYHASQGVFASIGGASATQSPPVLLEGAKSSDIVWVDDDLPAGASPFASENDRWNWVSENPAPFSGTRAHQAEIAPGLHLHFFSFATAPLTVNAGDTLFAHVYLDPENPPRQIVLTWLAGNWEHRAYWGENLIAEGADGGPGRRYMGALPPTGRWIRLEIPASAVDMENQTATGMGFNLYDGRVTWDRAGKSRP